MDKSAFERSTTGRVVPTIGGQWAFVPNDLPPILDMNDFVAPLVEATQLLGELNGVFKTLPDPYILIRPLQTKEALTSSSMEGTYTTIDELMLAEAGYDHAKQSADTREVLNYSSALKNAILSLSDIPLSLRTITTSHEDLLNGVSKARGAMIRPGELKAHQNWIGARTIENARFIPPPPGEAREALYALEKYIQRDGREKTPPLIEAALIHYQFETIHPFPDGNGRVGRILIPLYLFERKTIRHPVLYISPWLEKHKDEYIDRMFSVSKDGDWSGWIEFFLNAVSETCKATIQTADHLFSMRERYRKTLQARGRSALLLSMVDHIFHRPVFSIPQMADFLGVTYRAAQSNIDVLENAGIIEHLHATAHPKFYAARELLRAITNS
jgi:Fic family protein